MEVQFLCHDFKRRAQEPSILTLLSGALSVRAAFVGQSDADSEHGGRLLVDTLRPNTHSRSSACISF
jgi:hypothetical protein